MSKVPVFVAQAIASHVTDWSSSNQGIAYSLNHEMHPNPSPCPMVQRTVYSMEMFPLVNMQRAMAIVSHPTFQQVRADIKSQNIAALKEWILIYYSFGMITASEKLALDTYVDGQVNDPAYSPELSWSVLEFGREVDEEDVEAARIIAQGAN